MVHWVICVSASAGIRHVQKTYMYSDLGFPGFIGLDGNGTICRLDRHSRKWDLSLDCSYSRVAGLFPKAKSVANAIEYAPQSDAPF